MWTEGSQKFVLYIRMEFFGFIDVLSTVNMWLYIDKNLTTSKTGLKFKFYSHFTLTQKSCLNHFGPPCRLEIIGGLTLFCNDVRSSIRNQNFGKIEKVIYVWDLAPRNWGFVQSSPHAHWSRFRKSVQKLWILAWTIIDGQTFRYWIFQVFNTIE